MNNFYAVIKSTYEAVFARNLTKVVWKILEILRRVKPKKTGIDVEETGVARVYHEEEWGGVPEEGGRFLKDLRKGENC